MTSAGIMRGGGETALIMSLFLVLTLGSEDGWVTLGLGAGGALISRYLFRTQDYSGPFQFGLTGAVSVPLYKDLRLGYRFLHYSGAGLN